MGFIPPAASSLLQAGERRQYRVNVGSTGRALRAMAISASRRSAGLVAAGGTVTDGGGLVTGERHAGGGVQMPAGSAHWED